MPLLGAIIRVQPGSTVSTAASARKENRMDEPMTDFQFKKILQMVLEILKSSKDLPEAIKKIENLLEN